MSTFGIIDLSTTLRPRFQSPQNHFLGDFFHLFSNSLLKAPQRRNSSLIQFVFQMPPWEIVTWCNVRTVWHPLLWPQELHLLIREEFLGDPRCMRRGRILMENSITIWVQSAVINLKKGL
ncbi:hypothetical protein AVEN_116559-1 [Araneus ventricosus]|uniref:Uncharacterized protein n=1 Tax=Araneus ventricosus TaxID=182803 RepID=A0A4Y2RZN0_ARAVE|nr:hypothetical protein AVEN_116559-1 [Araneus ventricosus]